MEMADRNIVSIDGEVKEFSLAPQFVMAGLNPAMTIAKALRRLSRSPGQARP